MGDQERISPYNINNNINQISDQNRKKIFIRIISWSNTKFSKLTSQELYGREKGELLMRSWELKG